MFGAAYKLISQLGQQMYVVSEMQRLVHNKLSKVKLHERVVLCSSNISDTSLILSLYQKCLMYHQTLNYFLTDRTTALRPITGFLFEVLSR